MRPIVRTGLLSLLTLCATGLAIPSRAQDASKTAPTAIPTSPTLQNQVFATVNGDKITRGELINLFTRTPLPSGDEKQVYETGVNVLINNRLLSQFLTRMRVQVAPKEIQDEVDKIEKTLQEEKRTLQIALKEGNSTEAELRKQIADSLAWRNYVMKLATEAELRKYVETNRDAFNRTQVRASIILFKTDYAAPAAEKAKVQARAKEVKALIDSGKISFADAANKHSEDDANKATPNGGDLGYFLRKNQVNEALAVAAFAMRKGAISEPVETDFGWILIQVTDRKEGQPVDFDQYRNDILNQYAADLQEKLINDERKAAKIQITPMPADLFPKAPAAAGATTKPAPR